MNPFSGESLNPVVSTSLWNNFLLEMLTYNIERFSILFHSSGVSTRQIFYDLISIAFIAIFQFRCCHMILCFKS